jgi:hypothetical protein
VPAVGSRRFDRRRAERFAQLLDEANGGRRHHVRSRHDDELTSLVAFGKRVYDTTPTAPLDPDFRSALRASLLATAEREGIGSTAIEERASRPFWRQNTAGLSPAARAKQTRRRARRTIVITVAAGAIAVSGMSAASEGALPGDALYGMKRSTERAQLALTSSDLSRGQLFLEFARTRLAEAEAVQGDVYGFDAVLDDMDGDTKQGVRLLTTAAVDRRDASALDTIGTFLTSQHRQVATLREGAGAAERRRAGQSLALLDEIQTRADALRTALLCGAEPVAARPDALGPLPQQCPISRAPIGDQPLPAPTDEVAGQVRSPETPRAERKAPAGPDADQPSDDDSAEVRPKPEDLIDRTDRKSVD